MSGEANPPLPYSPAGLLSELTGHFTRSAFTSPEMRLPKESAESMFVKRRMEVLKSVAAIRASHETFGVARPSTRVRSLPFVKAARRDTTRKPLYPISTTNGFKTIDDLKRTDGTPLDAAIFMKGSLACDALGSPVPTEAPYVIPMTTEDPRIEVAEKHRAALFTPRPHLPRHIEESIVNFSLSLGGVKPYATSRSAKLETRHCFADRHDMNDRYVDRMLSCRPSKGLYRYF
ncbi:hypothetical protein JKF63_03180 [Porcisia hertigi]|uniref:Uncharacterized protein n=1 Tax=Porcisia hertigi TaxID=2761500 RepID=A0A836LH80_9TRYP|nr:hypothetical protein JKF63_03180 [Porcisia hertigi]